jgi:ABC-type antimicrobial peptide transport system permease subunit
VGIVGNERFRGLEAEAQPAVYVSTRQFPQQSFSLLVRTAGDPLALAADVRSAVRETDPGITFDRVTTIDGILAEQLMPRRATTDIVGGFALTALGLAALGIYGLLTVLMGSRIREIGVRLAVGASPSSILRGVLGFSLRMAAAGIVAGGFLALMTGRLVESLLVDVSPGDPLMLGTVAAVLLLTSLCASAMPAWRASRTNPVDVLRPE